MLSQSSLPHLGLCRGGRVLLCEGYSFRIASLHCRGKCLQRARLSGKWGPIRRSSCTSPSPRGAGGHNVHVDLPLNAGLLPRHECHGWPLKVSPNNRLCRIGRIDFPSGQPPPSIQRRIVQSWTPLLETESVGLRGLAGKISLFPGMTTKPTGKSEEIFRETWPGISG